MFGLNTVVICAFIVTIVLGGCTNWPSVSRVSADRQSSTSTGSLSQICENLLDQIERRVVAAGVADRQDTRVSGYPYLRVNRFLADFRTAAYGIAFDDWVRRMQSLAIRGIEAEILNLPVADQTALAQLIQSEALSGLSVSEAIHRCADALRTRDSNHSRDREQIRNRANRPDAYRYWQRVVGLYPVTAPVFRIGIGRWHDETRERFAIPVSSLDIKGRLIRYGPPADRALDGEEVRRILANTASDALGIPRLSPAEYARLFAHYAPYFDIDVVTNDDRPGRIRLDAQGRPFVDSDLPVVYLNPSFTRFAQKNLLQLNYTIWFPSRPAESSVDLLSGDLDGITWRVTLLPDGRPWVFDTIHNCGCYHLFFPSQFAKIREPQSFLDENAFMPQSNVRIDFDRRPIIRIASRTHYIERLIYGNERQGHAATYRFESADRLRSLPIPNGGRKSLYGEHGIVEISQRAERFFFWPMGIPSPGAMRQWGHHATAFVGRRHFDDPRLFEENFEITNP